MRRLLPLLLLLAVAGCARVGGEAFQPTVTDALRLGDGRAVGQTFRTAGDRIAAVDLLVATFGEPAPSGTLAVTVRAGADEPATAEIRVDGGALADNDWVRLRLDEALPSAGVASVEARWLGEGTIGLWANVPPVDRPEDVPLNDPYPGGELLLDGRRAPGDLAFRVAGTGGTAGAVAAAAGFLRSAGARLLDAPLFAAVWLVLVAAAGAVAARSFRRSRAVVELREGRPHEQQGEHQEARAQQAHEPVRHS